MLSNVPSTTRTDASNACAPIARAGVPNLGWISCGGRRKQAVPRHGEIDARSEHEHGRQAAEHARHDDRRPQPRRRSGPNSTRPTCATNASPAPDLLDRDDVHERESRREIDERHDGQAEPQRARHACASGSRTSPAIFVTSHHPPNEKNAATKAPGERGADGRRAGPPRRERLRSAASGRPCSRRPQYRIAAMRTSFNTASARQQPRAGPDRRSTCTAARATIAEIATTRSAIGPSGTMNPT